MTHSPGPPMVAAPAHAGAGGQLILEARQAPESLILPVFSSVRLLISALGRSQPWAVVPLDHVAQLASAAGVDQLVVDPEIPGEAWRWEPADLGGFTWEVSR